MTIRNDDLIRSFLADEARRATAAAPSFDQAIGRLAPRLGGRTSGASRRLVVLMAATLLLAAVLGTAVAVGSGIVRLPWLVERTDLGIFEPVAGRILYLDNDGLWAVDPDAASPGSTLVRVDLGGTATAEDVPLSWSSDGTRLLVAREGEPTFVLNADGSDSAIAGRLNVDRLLGIRDAEISPDGSRVVFVGQIRATSGGCCDWALYAVDADGGPAELLVRARFVVRHPTFSPDGTQIAYVDSFGDHNQSVRLIGADGSDDHEILANETTAAAVQPTGLAWSPAGDRIAVGLDGDIYTFAPDGSDFTRVITGGAQPSWSSDGSRLAYTVPCSGDATECAFAIADADGSNARELGFGILGPWHPGTVSFIPVVSSAEASPTASPRPTPAAEYSRFTSPTHRISIDYPAGWQPRPATEPWTGGELTYDSPAADVIYDPSLGGSLYLLIASQPYGDLSEDEWRDESVQQFCPNGYGFGSLSFPGRTGWVVECDGLEAIFLQSDSRGYLIRRIVPSDPTLESTYDWDWFTSILQTVDLRPQGGA